MLEKRVIIINGTGGSGKDTFVKFCQEINDKVINLSTIDTVKSIAKKMGWKGGKSEKDRKFLSDLKDLWSEYENGPFNDVKYKIESIFEMKSSIFRVKNMKNGEKYPEKPQKMVFFVHCREAEEIQKFVDFYGEECETLLIKRENQVTKGNHADENVENYDYDTVFEFKEDSLGDMKRVAKEFMSQFND